MVDDLELCLTFNNSKFNHQHFLKTDGTAQGSISCSYADIFMAKHDSLVITFHLNPSLWKRFRDIFVLWEHSTASLSSFLDYLNTMEIVGNTCLEFLDLKLNEGKIRVDIYVKSTNSFSYTTPNTNYPKNNICNITRGIDLRLRRICDDDKTFEKRQSDYQKQSIHCNIVVLKRTSFKYIKFNDAAITFMNSLFD